MIIDHDQSMPVWVTQSLKKIALLIQLTREESRDESIAWRHLFTSNGNNDDKSETIGIVRREYN